ncbi:unnamed protein product [Closterium sp. NIES-53]
MRRCPKLPVACPVVRDGALSHRGYAPGARDGVLSRHGPAPGARGSAHASPAPALTAAAPAPPSACPWSSRPRSCTLCSRLCLTPRLHSLQPPLTYPRQPSVAALRRSPRPPPPPSSPCSRGGEGMGVAGVGVMGGVLPFPSSSFRSHCCSCRWGGGCEGVGEPGEWHWGGGCETNQQLSLHLSSLPPSAAPAAVWGGGGGGGEFSSDLLRDFCRGEGIIESFTLPNSPQQNGIAERRIGLVMEFYHPTSRRVLPSQDVTFDESVSFYHLFPYRSAPSPPPLLFLAPGPPPIDPLPPQGPAPSGQEGRGAGGGRGRGRGGRGGRGGGAASMKSAGNESESRDDRFPGQFFFVSTQAPAGPEKDEGFEEPAAVGKVTLHSLDYWVIDSGATYSMTPHADLLTELEPSPVKHVTSALGQRAEVKGMGKAMFKGADGKMVGLKNILLVPMPKERQVAASISTKGEAVGSGDGTNGRAKEMKSKKCNIGVTSKLGEHEESGAAAKKQHKDEENPTAAADEEYGENMWGTIARAAFSNPTSATGECDWLTLHRRMGHVALPILQKLVKNEMVAGIRVKGEPDEVLGCPTCMQAKFTRYPFSSSEATAKAPLDEVVMDVVGPLKLGAARDEYFPTIVDVYTRMTWVYVLSKKSDVAQTVKTDWLPMVERQQDRLVKAIRTDRGGEFLSKEFSLWMKKNGIRHSLTIAYSPAMNGIAERANRTITETARGLLIEAGLPEYFWPDAVRSACVAKNRVLTHVGADKWVPYVEWIGRKPKVDMLRVFGCMCMALVPKHLRHNKLGAVAIWAVHLGMAQNSKGWLLWDPFTKKFLVSRDCKFMENLMYKDWKAENEAKIGMRFGEVKGSGLEHVELPLKLSSGSTTTRQSSLVNGGEEAKDAEEEEKEVQQVSERAPTLPSRTTSAPRIRVTPQQRQGLHFPAAEEEGRGKWRIQAPNRLTYDALGKPAKSALAGAALIVGDDEESDYEECAFVFFSPVEMPGEPATLKEALESSDAEEWKKAMESELKSIEENGTWELVELPEGRKAITSKWLFKIKSDADGKIERYKSRLVVKGYQQKEKVDYKELFAPVVKPTTLRTLFAGAAIKGWVVKQMDVTTAFLNGVLEEEIFMAQPEGFDDGSGRVMRLKKDLYGLKQAPRQWYLKLRGVLEEIRFTPSSADHSLFMVGEGEQRSFMVVYVDDILIFSPSSDLVKEVMLKLQDKFKCKALGDVSFYLGLHIERDVEKRCMRVHQRKYSEALAANVGQSEGHVDTTFPSGFKCVKGPEEESVGEEERHRFHSLVGSLMYAAVNTRPDVAFATGQLARVVQCPNEEKVAAGMRVAKYLGQTPTVGLQYSAAAQRRQKGADSVEPGRLFLTAFSDSSFASEPEDMTSVGGFICCVGGGPIAWESKKQVDQALSSVESEYMTLFRAVQEIVWQRRLLAELGEEQQGPTPLYCDSQGAIDLAKNPVLHGLTKHMRVDPLPGTALVQVAVGSGAAPGAASGGAASGGVASGGAASRGAASGGAEPGGAGSEGAGSGGAEPEGVEPGGADSEGAESGGAAPRGAALSRGPAGTSPRLSSQQLREWLVRCAHRRSGAPGAGGAGDTGARGAAVTTGTGGTGGTAATGPGGARTFESGAAGTSGVGCAGARDPTEPGTAGARGVGAGGPGVGGPSAGGAGAARAGCPPPDQSQPPLPPASPLPTPSPYTEQSGALTERREPASRLVSPVHTTGRTPCSCPPRVPGTHAMALRPSSVPLRVPLPAPHESSLPKVPDPASDRARATSPTVSRLLATAVTDPSFQSATASALVAELLDFAAACRLDYATALVAEFVSASPPSVGGECVLEDRQEDFECLAAAVPRFASMLLAPEGDPDAPDIPTPRSYAEAIAGPYSSQ